MEGIAYPLYFNFLPSYLATKFTQNASLNLTYRNYCITSAVGIVGPVSAGFLVNVPRFGRRWMMGISAIITGVFLFAYVGVNSPTSSLAFSCVTGLLGNFGAFYSRLRSYIGRVVSCSCSNKRRICRHVRLHSRILSRTASRHWNWNGCHAASVWWADRQYNILAVWFYDCAYLCQCRALGGCGGHLLRVAI